MDKEDISIHAPRTGSDQKALKTGADPVIFQSTLPARGATGAFISMILTNIFQSTLPARGATAPSPDPNNYKQFQSTLPARGATCARRYCTATKRFQSTLPARGATSSTNSAKSAKIDFNPRSPHGERQILQQSLIATEPFQSTLPARGATLYVVLCIHLANISIHAPRTGSDQMEEKTKTAGTDFNPRSPHGERRPAEWRTPMIYKFQSTLPARGATYIDWLVEFCVVFQSTLPARGATATMRRLSRGVPNFNPRSPHGERRAVPGVLHPDRDFNPRSPHGERRGTISTGGKGDAISIHAPRTGSDAAMLDELRKDPISIHAPRTGSDVHLPLLASPAGDISIHAPRTGSDPAEGTNEAAEWHFNPRSPHGERPGKAENGHKKGDFNPRSPHGERQGALQPGSLVKQFQSTLPARGATKER